MLGKSTVEVCHEKADNYHRLQVSLLIAFQINQTPGWCLLCGLPHNGSLEIHVSRKTFLMLASSVI